MKRTQMMLSAFALLGLAATACTIADPPEDITSRSESEANEPPISTSDQAQSEKDVSPPEDVVENETELSGIVPDILPQPAPAIVPLSDMAGPRSESASARGLMFNMVPYISSPREDRERYQDVDGNPVRLVSDEPVSTFSIDVDTASYANARRFLKDGQLPPVDAVRVEEMINYFDYAYAAPIEGDQPFSTDVALYTSPWDAGTQLLRIGIKGYEIETAERPAANLVFLVDTSGSMDSPDKLPLLKRSLRLLADEMRDDDRIAIVTYAGSAGVVLEPTSGDEKGKIRRAIDDFQARGSTAGADGLRQAYELASDHFDEGAINRVILATDGDFNVGVSDPARLEDVIAAKRETGVYLSILGFGRGNLNDHLMQKLAQAGNGNASYIDSLMEARKVLVEEMGSTLFPIADDVKIQIEFNPKAVAEYRLIGYETRMLEREDFNNDQVDAGEIGSGHTVTALYEITPVGSPSRLVDDLRYGVKPAAATEDPADDEMAWLRLRYKQPGEDVSQLIEQPVLAAMATDFDQAPEEARFATAVAGFGQILRQSPHIGDFDLDAVLEIARASRGDDPFGYRAEFLQLIGLAESARVLEPVGG